MIKLFLFFGLLIPNLTFAQDSMKQLLELSGGYLGTMYKEDMQMVIKPDAEKPGTYLVAVMNVSKKTAALFYGELIPDFNTIGLKPVGRSENAEELEFREPVASLNVFDKKVKITAHASSKMFPNPVDFTRHDKSVELVDGLPIGRYNGDTNYQYVVVGPNGWVETSLPGINGNHRAHQDLKGSTVLRGVVFNSNYQSNESSKVSGLAIVVKHEGTRTLYVTYPERSGSFSNVTVLR